MTRRDPRIPLLAVAIGLITLAHFTTPLEMGFLHNVYQRLYYLPILAAAYWYGIKGGLTVSVVSAACYLPHIMHDWAGYPQYRQAQYAELIMFQVVALVVGAFSESGMRQRQRLEQASLELTQAYRKLQDSVDQLRRADRLSVLGQLSAGLAHEIKNPLASMKGSVEILATEFPTDHDKHEFVEILEKELDRLNEVLGEFLQFARPPRPDRRPCDLREVVDSIRVLCSKEAHRQGVTIESQYGPSLPELELDAAQVQQALLNIVLNGIQAMPNGGRLSISVVREDEEIQIAVRDEGPGVAPEDRSRIFDPFFTTKDGGTGLGMAIAHNLIQGHGGDIRLADEQGQGATFLITLPMRMVPHE